MLELTGVSCGGLDAISILEAETEVLKIEYQEKHEQALNRLRYLVAKDLPKPPKYHRAERAYHDWYTCPKCGRQLIDRPNFCSNCGSSLDWNHVKGRYSK